MQWFDEDENRLIPTFIKPQHFHPMVAEGVVFANSCGIWNEEGQEKYTPTLIRKNCKGGFQKLHGDKTHHTPLQHKLDIIYDHGKICKYPFRASQNNLKSRDTKKLSS